MNINNKPIGFFDSGLGGLSVLKVAKEILPNESFIYYGDGANIPYGTKTVDELIDLSDKICNDFINKYSVKAIVIACNTATSAAVKYLRKKYDIPIIGMEPALKPAVNNHANATIGVLATEVTLKEKKFKLLESKYIDKAKIIKLPAPNLVELVETGLFEGELAEKEIKKALNGYEKGLDAIVLGCTHFVFLKKTIHKILGSDVKIYDGNEGTVKHLKNILKKGNALSHKNNNGINEDIGQNIIIINSAGEKLEKLSWNLLQSLK